MHVFFSAGEPSGDIHGANLVRELRRLDPDLKAVGLGGPELAGAGCELLADMSGLALMWFARVLLRLHKFLALLVKANRYFRDERPDAVVLIDFPGFNWWIARRAKAHGIPVFYYGPPQIWGWASWRIKKMRRLVDHILCKLPFEEAWYRARGCAAHYVGHPFFDEVRRRELDAGFLERQTTQPGQLVAILPGSRTQELEANLRWLLKAAETVRRDAPTARFTIAAYRSEHAEFARRTIASNPAWAALPIEIHTGRTPELMHAAVCAMSVSGSVSLELLHHATPTVIVYQISPLANCVQGYLRRVKYITLVNLLATENIDRIEAANYDPRRPGAEAVPFPEYLTSEDRTADIAWHITGWLKDEDSRQQTITWLEKIREQVGAGGASRRAAEYICKQLSQASTMPDAPHTRAA